MRLILSHEVTNCVLAYCAVNIIFKQIHMMFSDIRVYLFLLVTCHLRHIIAFDAFMSLLWLDANVKHLIMPIYGTGTFYRAGYVRPITDQTYTTNIGFWPWLQDSKVPPFH